MAFHMTTTIELPEDLFVAAKKEAAERREAELDDELREARASRPDESPPAA